MKHTVSMKENHLFRRLYNKGQSTACPTLAVYVRRNGRRESRLGLTVGTTVVRNKVRRRIREAYRIHEEKMAPGWDIVVVARVRSAFAPYRDLQRDLLRALDKLGVYRR